MKKHFIQFLSFSLFITALTISGIMINETKIARAGEPQPQVLFSGYDSLSSTNDHIIQVSGVRGWKSKGFQNSITEIANKSATNTSTKIGIAYLYSGDTIKHKLIVHWNDYSTRTQTTKFRVQFFGNTKCNISTQQQEFVYTQSSITKEIALTPNASCEGGSIKINTLYKNKSASSFTWDRRTYIEYQISHNSWLSYDAASASVTRRGRAGNYFSTTFSKSFALNYPFSKISWSSSIPSNIGLSCKESDCSGTLTKAGTHKITIFYSAKGTDAGGKTYTLFDKAYTFTLETEPGDIDLNKTTISKQFSNIGVLILNASWIKLGLEFRDKYSNLTTTSSNFSASFSSSGWASTFDQTNSTLYPLTGGVGKIGAKIISGSLTFNIQDSQTISIFDPTIGGFGPDNPLISDNSSSTYTTSSNEVVVKTNDNKFVVITDISKLPKSSRQIALLIAKQNLSGFTILSKKGNVTKVKMNPSSKLTKTNAALILWQLSSKPKTNNSIKINDITSKNSTTKSAIKWAVSKKILNKCKTNKFCPNQKITKATISTIIRKFLKNPKDKIPTFIKFKDINKASKIDRKNIYWSYHYGFLSQSKGSVKKNNLYFDPKKVQTKSGFLKLLAKAKTFISNNYKEDIVWFRY